MALPRTPSRQTRPRSLLLLLGLMALLALSAAAVGQQRKLSFLRIGASSSLASEVQGGKEKAALKSLQSFIKDETRLDNEIIRLKDWRELTDKMTKKELELGVYQGYEFAWAQEKTPGLKPLAIAVNIYRYPVVHVVASRNNPAKDIAGLEGQSLALPATGQSYLRLFVDRQVEALGKKPASFFSKIHPSENVEDALDDVVDGAVKAAVADRAALDAYKRRKPGRFKQLKEIARSQPFPPTTVAYYNSVLDEPTLKRFRDGLLNASRSERGETMLTFFRLSGFEAVPSDFDRVLAETRTAYPPPK